MKLFKRKQPKNCITDDEPIPYDIPATYGAEYDEYDYFYTKVPSDTQEWERYYSKCETCGKYHWLNKVNTHYFYSMDGYDSISYTECWKCRLKDKIYAIKAKIKRKRKVRKEYRKEIRLFKDKGVEITDELKNSVLKFVNKEG